jgi:tetratricopeptide (TPR) repeat protein
VATYERGGAPSGLVSESEEGIQKARRARQFLKTGDWEKASALYRELTQEFPEDAELRRHFILNAFRNQDYQEVIQQSLDMADLSLMYDDTSAALERYSEILRLPELVAGDHGNEAGEKVAEMVEPLKGDIYFSYGDHYLAVQNPEMALQYFDVSERNAPGRWETQWGAGQAYLMLGEKSKAIESLYSSVNSAPSDAASAYELLGEVLLSEGRELPELREMFYRASVIFEKYEFMEDALRLALRWLQLDNQDREMTDRARELNRLMDARRH